MAAKKGTSEGVKFQLRKGLSLNKGCEAAGYSKSTLWRQRQADPKLDAEIKNLMAGRKPLRSTHLNLTGRGTKQAQGAQEFWDRWNAAAKKGKLRKEFGLRINDRRPPVRRVIVIT
ncbi:hypothetical protein LCGC14_0491240 [marine sediment metagenome]|uniref:Uncharacterized protein n=1 Tax=marine sediment metagenome TaxID=412755 RepID=A0A0F9UTJ4_9ZZZZ